jgi:hypothetical protein
LYRQSHLQCPSIGSSRRVAPDAVHRVRVWGDTAVVTAELWLKYKAEGKAVDRKLWFGDTYVRTPKGWRYAFGRASLGLPPEMP